MVVRIVGKWIHILITDDDGLILVDLFVTCVEHADAILLRTTPLRENHVSVSRLFALESELIMHVDNRNLLLKACI